MKKIAPYYSSGFERNQQECFISGLDVQGKIPDWLNGQLVRNGPGLVDLPGQRLNHWFDGLAALHGFSIRNGKVDYLCRFLESASYHAAREGKKLTYSEFATDPCKSIFKKVQSYVVPSPPNMTDNPKVSLAKIGDKYFALGETPMMIEFDPATLATLSSQELIPGGFAYKTTAHPHFDQGKAYNLVVKFGMFSHYRIHELANPQKPLASTVVRNPAYLHGFGITPNYFIVAAGPFTAVPLQLLYWHRPYVENHTWNPEKGAHIYIFERSTGKLKVRFETEAFFAFHHVNAWEEGEEIVMDLDAYDDADIIQSYYRDELADPAKEFPIGTIRRFRMNLRTKKVACEVRSSACIELPRIDYDRYNMSSDYRHVYGVSIHPDHRKGFYNAIVKINPEKGTSDYWYEAGTHPGEPFFMPSPGSKKDDQGVLMSIVLDAKKNNSFLLVLRAEDLSELARVLVPEPILYGFHTEFFAS
ncbi:MAG: carotenoid oxygenase family protein [Bacteroidota bacterium]